MVIETAEPLLRKIPHGQIIKIRLEVDTDPPSGFETENKFLLHPVPVRCAHLRSAGSLRWKNACGPVPAVEEPRQGPRLVRPGLVCRQSSQTACGAPGPAHDPERRP